MTALDTPLSEAMQTMTVGEFFSQMKDYLKEHEVVVEDPRDRNLSINDVARLIGVSVSTVRRMIEDGMIPDGNTSIGRGGRKLWSYRSIQPAILQHQKGRK